MKAGLQSYKLGFAALFVLVLGLVIMVFVQAGKTKQDTKTYNAATSIANKLNEYVITNSAVPNSLAQAGVTSVPSTITYTKLSDTSYKFCITYQTGSSGISGSDAISNAIASSVLSLNSGGSFSASNTSLYIDSSYHKGLNCQTVDTSSGGILPLSGGGGGVNQSLGDSKTSATAAGNQSNVCNQTGYSVHYSGKITNVKTLYGSTSNTNDAQSYILTIQPNGNPPQSVKTVTVTPTFKVFDSSCNTTDGSILQTGDDIAVFQANSNTQTSDAIQDLSF